jgi:hypothetical protein
MWVCAGFKSKGFSLEGDVLENNINYILGPNSLNLSFWVELIFWHCIHCNNQLVIGKAQNIIYNGKSYTIVKETIT